MRDFEEDIINEEGVIEESETEFLEITPEDEAEANEIVDEILSDEGSTSPRDKIPRYKSNDLFVIPNGKKLTCFVDGYLITLDDVDAKLLNKLEGQKREEYLDNIKAKSNERLIYKVANRIMRFESNTIVNVDKDELYAAGWHALAKAIKTFDPSKKLLFTTYSYRIILNEMIQEVKKVKKKVKNKIGDEMVESMAINISMDAPLSSDNNGNNIYFSDVIADTADRPDQVVDKDDLKITIMRALDMLDPTEKFVITYRYGLDRDVKLTQKEIADKLKQSQANISKIEKNSRAKLKILLQGKIDENFL